jgi:tyrosyl-tRNA synthetase
MRLLRPFKDIPDYHLSEPTNIISLMVDAKMVASKSEARRLIQQGGVSYYASGESGEAERISSPDWIVPVRDGAILKVGKLQYIRIKA